MEAFNMTGGAEIGANYFDFVEFTTNKVITFTLVFVAIFTFQVWNGLGKLASRKSNLGGGGGGEREKLLGPERIHGPRPVEPTGIIGNIPNLLPVEKTFSHGLRWSEQYGDAFKLAGLNQTWVVLNSGPLVQTLLKSSDMGHITKSPLLYGQLRPYVVNGLFVSEGKFWQHERKLMMKSQSYANLKEYVPMLNRHSKSFASSLEEMSKDGKPHPINAEVNTAFVKMIGELLTGVADEQSEEYMEYHHNFQIWKQIFAARLSQPWLLLNPLWRLHPLSKKHDRTMEAMFDFTKRRIAEHKQKRMELESKKILDNGNDCGERKQEKGSFRGVLDDLVDGGVDERQIIDEVNTLLAAGHETGATAVHCMLFCMALNPEIQRKCQAEVDELFEDPSHYKDGSVTFEALASNLKLVERCILETMRLIPPIFAVVRRLTSSLKIDCNGQGYELPPGTNVAVAPFLIHRKAEYYPEPEKFNPDRFLPEECAKRHAYSYIPFSGGPRNCIGLKFAMMQMKIMAAYALRHFSFATEDKMEDIPLLPFITTTPARDYTFQISQRDHARAA